MKRCVYGLTINLSGLSKGSVTFNYNPKSLGHSESYETTVNGTVFSDIISFCYTYECWLKSFTDEDYSKTVNLEVIWAYTYEGTNATDSFQKTESITLKRNVMTTVNINLDINTKDQTENSFNLTRSETTMGSEEYDYNYTISLNGTVDNPVNP